MPAGSLPPWLVLTGTFLPVLAILATLALAVISAGRTRWLILVLVPGLALWLCWWMAPAVLYNGNLLAAVLLMLFYIATAVYYPVLLLVATIQTVRRRQARAS